MKKVVYLGGYYPAEQSIRRSFEDHEADIVFPYDIEARYAEVYEGRRPKPSRSSHKPVLKTHVEIADPLFESSFIMQDHPRWLLRVTESRLETFLEHYKPDVIVHRYYFDNPVMHHHARETAEKLDIPYVVYRMETMPVGDFKIKPVMCDVFLYANKCDEQYITHPFKEWWSWGVSSMERNLHRNRPVDLAGFGLFRHNSIEKHANLSFFIRAAKKAGRKIRVYWGSVTPEWAYLSRELDNQQLYTMNESTERMNECKVAINYETVAGISGCWSHKIWQSMGCGTPTITMMKPEYEEMFEGALVEVVTGQDATDKISVLLEDPDTWELVSKRSEEVVHDKFDWYKNFDKIMRRHGIW